MSHLRDVETEFDALDVFRAARVARREASLAAQSLELTPADANRLMVDKLRFYTGRYSTVTRQGDRREIRAQAGAIERCLRDFRF